MKYVLIIHKVKNYFAWKKIFDSASVIKKQAGEIPYQILKYETKPNKIVHFLVCSSLERAKIFFQSPNLVKIKTDAGVKSPDFI